MPIRLDAKVGKSVPNSWHSEVGLSRSLGRETSKSIHLHMNFVVQFCPSQFVGSVLTATLPVLAHSSLAAACAWAGLGAAA
jgi:hypothetical protein